MRASIAAPVLVALGLSTTPAAAVDIIRGSAVGAADTQVATVTQEGGIQVHRGAASKPRTRSVPQPQEIRLIGGDNLWIVDGDKVVGCEIRPSTQVATNLIRCSKRKLSILR